MAEVKQNLQFKRGVKSVLEARLTSTDLGVLKAGEPVYELDSNKIKIGDGIHDYINLPYIGSGEGGLDPRFKIVNPTNNQILVYDNIEQKFINISGQKVTVVPAKISDSQATKFADENAKNAIIGNADVGAPTEIITGLSGENKFVTGFTENKKAVEVSFNNNGQMVLNDLSFTTSTIGVTKSTITTAVASNRKISTILTEMPVATTGDPIEITQAKK